MNSFEAMLYSSYITPGIENEELMECFSALWQELTPSQQKLCEQLTQMYSTKSFLLGVRTGARLERFLRETPQT